MKTLLLIFCFISPGLTTFSQTDSLQYYLVIAAKNNPSVLQKFAEYQSALKKVPQAGGLPDPSLSLGVFLSPMELVGGNQVADIRLMQMFPWFGVLKSAKDEMSLMAKAKFESLRDLKLQLFYDVQRTWLDLNKVKQNILISEKNIELLQTIERLATVRFKAAQPGNSPASGSDAAVQASAGKGSSGPSGMSNMENSPGSSPANRAGVRMSDNSMGPAPGISGLADVYRIQIEIGDLQNNIELLKNQLKTTSALFNSYLNRPQNAVVTLPDTLMAENFEPSMLSIPDSISKNNPMLEMLQLEHQSIEARQKMVTKMGYPMVGLGLDYALINKNPISTSAMNGKDMVMPMITATLPIYRKKYKAMREEADLLKSANSQNYQTIANSLQTEYYQALQLFGDANRRVRLYKNQYMLAARSLEIMLKSFASSTAALTDVLRVRQQMLDYEYKQIEAIADNNLSIAWLKRLSNIEKI